MTHCTSLLWITIPVFCSQCSHSCLHFVFKVLFRQKVKYIKYKIQMDAVIDSLEPCLLGSRTQWCLSITSGYVRSNVCLSVCKIFRNTWEIRMSKSKIFRNTWEIRMSKSYIQHNCWLHSFHTSNTAVLKLIYIYTSTYRAELCCLVSYPCKINAWMTYKSKICKNLQVALM